MSRVLTNENKSLKTQNMTSKSNRKAEAEIHEDAIGGPLSLGVLSQKVYCTTSMGRSGTAPLKPKCAKKIKKR